MTRSPLLESISLAEWHKTFLPVWKFLCPRASTTTSLYALMSTSCHSEEVVRKTASSNLRLWTKQSLIKKTASRQAWTKISRWSKSKLKKVQSRIVTLDISLAVSWNFPEPLPGQYITTVYETDRWKLFSAPMQKHSTQNKFRWTPRQLLQITSPANSSKPFPIFLHLFSRSFSTLFYKHSSPKRC